MKGFVAISTVVILMAVVVAVGTTVTLLSIGEAQSGLSLFKGEEILGAVEGCVEDAMLKARSNPAFGDPVGTPVNISRPFPEPTCVVTVNSKSGSGTITWNMSATTNTTEYKRTVRVIFDRSPTGITLSSWKEI